MPGAASGKTRSAANVDSSVARLVAARWKKPGVLQSVVLIVRIPMAEDRR